MLISISSLSTWTGAPLIATPTLGPVFTSKNKLGYTPSEVLEHNSNPDNKNMVCLDILLIKNSHFVQHQKFCKLDEYLYLGCIFKSFTLQIIIPGKLELSPFVWSDIKANINTTLSLGTTATCCKRLTLPAGTNSKQNVCNMRIWEYENNFFADFMVLNIYRCCFSRLIRSNIPFRAAHLAYIIWSPVRLAL